LQVYLFIIFRIQPISQGVTLLFFFTEKKKRSKKRKELALHLYYKVKLHTKITRRIVDILVFPIDFYKSRKERK